MKLVLKEKVFTLKERFNVTDEQEQPLYSVEGKFFSWGHQLDIEDASGAHVAHIQQKVLALLPRYFITCDGMEEMGINMQGLLGGLMPKRKKRRHVLFVAADDTRLSEKIKREEKISNIELRRTLAAYRGEAHPDQEG